MSVVTDVRDTMNVTLRDGQWEAVEEARRFLTAKKGKKFPTRLLFASATGTGKSFVELDILRVVPGGVLLTPSNDILVSLISKREKLPAKLSDAALRKLAAKHSMYTPLTFRNQLLAGEIEPPAYIIWDEVHHQTASTWSDVSTLTDVKEVGFTATPYRGTPKGTVDFKERWGEARWIYTYPDAIERGYISMPSFETVPLLDDDTIEIVAGEFQVARVEAETRSRLLALAELIRSKPLDRPTMVTLPTRSLVYELLAVLGEDFAVAITGDTERTERREAYRLCLASKRVLLQIAVVGEGVDLAIRRIFDASPTLSPVRWVQMIGRAMRPCPACGKLRKPGTKCRSCSEAPPSEVIVTNRNLLRHVYALQGVVPSGEVSKSQEFFGMGTRSGSRAFGLEGLGRFKANPLPLVNGLKGEVYLIENRVDGSTTQYACVLHPCYESPLWATRLNALGSYGRWTTCEAPEGFKGFSSGTGAAPSPKQRAWWEKSARKYGLDPEAEVNRRTFAALPILADLGVTMEN